MGDRTSMTVWVKAPWQLMPAIADVVQQYADENRDPDPEGEPKATTVEWTTSETSCGNASNLASALRGLMEEGDEERGIPPTRFAYFLWEDPKYDWLGDLYIYVPSGAPGVPAIDYTSECDANGEPVVLPWELLKILDGAQTLEEARRQVAQRTGQLAAKAWRDYTPAVLPEQLALDAAEA